MSITRWVLMEKAMDAEKSGVLEPVVEYEDVVDTAKDLAVFLGDAFGVEVDVDDDSIETAISSMIKAYMLAKKKIDANIPEDRRGFLVRWMHERPREGKPLAIHYRESVDDADIREDTVEVVQKEEPVKDMEKDDADKEFMRIVKEISRKKKEVMMKRVFIKEKIHLIKKARKSGLSYRDIAEAIEKAYGMKISTDTIRRAVGEKHD